MFNNAKQSVPELFKEKIAIDKEAWVIENEIRINASLPVSGLWIHKRLKNNQVLKRKRELSNACAQFIQNQRVTGKDNRG